MDGGVTKNSLTLKAQGQGKGKTEISRDDDYRNLKIVFGHYSTGIPDV